MVTRYSRFLLLCCRAITPKSKQVQCTKCVHFLILIAASSEASKPEQCSPSPFFSSSTSVFAQICSAYMLNFASYVWGIISARLVLGGADTLWCYSCHDGSRPASAHIGHRRITLKARISAPVSLYVQMCVRVYTADSIDGLSCILLPA